MLHKLRSRRPGHTTVAAYLALFLALGGGAAYAGQQITGGQVQDGSLTGRDIRDRSLTRGDLGVSTASQKQTSTRDCGRGDDFLTCVTTEINVLRPQRLFVVASGEWESAATDNAEAECVIQVDEGSTAYGRRTFGEIKTAPSSPFNFTSNSVTQPVQAGRRQVKLRCRTTNGTMRSIKDAELTVVALGDG